MLAAVGVIWPDARRLNGTQPCASLQSSRGEVERLRTLALFQGQRADAVWFSGPVQLERNKIIKQVSHW